MKIRMLSILLAALLAWSCGRQTESEDTVSDPEMELPTELPTSFTEFYKQFLTDPEYQLDHIVFPVQGLPDKADSTTLARQDFEWTADSWVVHRPIDKRSGFSINFLPLTEDYILERIVHESGQYGMERRYAYQDDGWYLIYYAGLNALNAAQ